jgi:predicted nucleic acid-binding protein
MSTTPIILDASAFLRATRGQEEASSWIERIVARQVRAHAPDLIHAEVANGLLGHVRAGDLDPVSAAKFVNTLRRLPIRVVALRELALPALRLAASRGLSVYDACYVVLADATRAPVLTADRRLSRIAVESILLE